MFPDNNWFKWILGVTFRFLEAPLTAEVPFTPVIRQRADREQQGQQGLNKTDIVFYPCHHGECWKKFRLFQIPRFADLKFTPISFHRV